MMSNLIQAFVATLLWSGPLIVSALIATFIVWKRFTDDLWWTDFWVSFPLIGKMQKWKKQTHGIENLASWKAAGLPPAEEHLCSTYIDKLPKIDPVVFNNANEYLKLTHQNGRSPMSQIAWVALGLLTVAEAAGTGMLIAPFVSSEITGNQMVWIGYVIALVMAVGLLGLTHAAGKDMYKRSSIKKALGSVNATAEGYSGQKISSGDDQRGQGRHAEDALWQSRAGRCARSRQSVAPGHLDRFAGHPVDRHHVDADQRHRDRYDA